MSVTNLVLFRNKTRETQYCLIGGEKHEVTPLGELLLTPAEAELADIKYLHVLQRVEQDGLGTPLKEEDPDAPIWLANMSGNPDAPEYVVTGTFKNPMTGLHEERKVLNPLAKPVDYLLRRKAKRERVKIEGTTTELTPPTQHHYLRVEERRPVQKQLAQAFLRSTEGLPSQSQGWIIVSRPPASFEPDHTWSYDDLCMWFGLVKSDIDISEWPTEEDLRKDRAKGPADKKVETERRKMLRRCFYVCADPRYVLPTRSEFESYVGRTQLRDVIGTDVKTEEDQELEEKVVEAQTRPAKTPSRAGSPPKKRGRPRKNARPSAT